MHFTPRALSIAAVVLACFSLGYGQTPTPSPATSTTPTAEKVTSDRQASANATVPPSTPAPDPDFWTQQELTGDWGGARSRWKEKGVELEFELSNFFQGVASGGLEEGSEYNGKFEFTMKFDLGKVAGWKYWSSEIKAEARWGGPLLGGAGDERFFNIAQIGPLTVLRQAPLIANGASFAYVKHGEPRFSIAVLDPNDHALEPGLDNLFGDGVTFYPTVYFPVKYFGRTAKHTFSGAVTTKKYTPFDAIQQAIIPGPPVNPVEPQRGSWSISYVFRQYVVERGHKDGWGFFSQLSSPTKPRVRSRGSWMSELAETDCSRAAATTNSAWLTPTPT